MGHIFPYCNEVRANVSDPTFSAEICLVLLNFIWCAIGCACISPQFKVVRCLILVQVGTVDVWQRVFGVFPLFERWTNSSYRVCITAIWPSFNTLPNHLPAGMYTTTSEFIGFVVFWALTLPLLWIPPEKFRRPFQFISIYTAVALLSVCEWYFWLLSFAGPHHRFPCLDSGLVISQGKGRRSHLLYQSKHQSISLVSLLVNHGRHQLVHRGSSRWNDERIRLLAIRQE